MSVDRVFRGFPPEAFKFLAGLAKYNRKDWFEARRGEYERSIVAPALAFADEMARALRSLAPSVRGEPRVGGSLFRIHRDSRFGRDKSPYKTHVGFRLRDGDTVASSKCTGPLFYVELEAERVTFGIGVKRFTPPLLDAYRGAILREDAAWRVASILAQVESAGHVLDGGTTRRIPVVLSELAGTPLEDLARRKGIFVRFVETLPQEIHCAAFVPYCIRRFRPYVPLFNWLHHVALKEA